MVSEVKKLILQGPRPWNSTPSNLGRFALQFGEVWKVDFSLVFLSDLSHCISLGHLDRVPIWLPAASGVGNQTIFIIHWCARHLFLNWHWPKLNCLGQTRQLQIVFFVFWRNFALLNHVSKQDGGGEEVFEAYKQRLHYISPSLVPQPTCCWKFCFSKSDGDPVYISPRVDYFKCISEDVQNCGGGDREIFERRSKVLDSYQDLRVHHTSLPPDLHPFQVIITWSW